MVKRLFNGLQKWFILVFLFTVLTACGTLQKANNQITEKTIIATNQETIANVEIATAQPQITSSPPTNNPNTTPELEKTIQSGPEWFDITNANYIEALLVDQKGDLWTVGSGGVVHWDQSGNEYVKYTMNQGLPSNNITDIVESEDGTLWISACPGGIYQFDGKIWRDFTPGEVAPLNCVTSLTITKDGLLWVGSVALRQYDGTDWTIYPLLSSNNPYFNPYSVYIDVITEGPDGDLWIGASGEHNLMRFDGKNFIDYTPFLPEPSVQEIEFSPDGTMWVGGNGYLASFVNGTWQFYTDVFDQKDVEHDISVSSIAFSEDGTIWVGFVRTRSWNPFSFRGDSSGISDNLLGISKYKDGNWVTIDLEDGVNLKEVTDIFVDSSENIWFGTYEDGVFSSTNAGWRTFKTSDDIPTNDIRNLKVVSPDQLWITYPNKISFYDGQTWQNFTMGNVGGNYIFTTPDGSLWLDNNDGLFRYKNNHLTPYSEIFDDNFNYIETIIMVGNEQFIFLTSGSGVYQLDEVGWKRLSLLSELDKREGINNLAIDHQGKIWIITNYEIYVLKDMNMNIEKTYNERDGVGIGVDTKLLVDTENTIWVGGFHGLFGFDGQKWTEYKIENNKFGDVQDMKLDPAGNLWVLTDSGLYSFEDKEWIDHHLTGSYVQLEIDDTGTIWLNNGTLTKYIPGD